MMEKHLPFIAAIISGVITWVATALFLQQYLALMSILLLVAIPLLRFNAWTLIGGFLTGLAIELFNRGATEQFHVAILMLIIGTGLQLAAVFLPSLVRGLRLPESSLGQNMLFALIGIMVFYGLQFLRCPPVPRKGVPYFLTVLIDCKAHMAFVERALASNYEFCNLLALNCLLTPVSFAALRQSNFVLRDFRHLVAHTVTAVLGWVLSFVAVGLALILLFVACEFLLILPSVAYPTRCEEGLPEIAWLIIYLTPVVFGTAWGARWGAS